MVRVLAWPSAYVVSSYKLTVSSRNWSMFLPLLMVTCISGTSSEARDELGSLDAAGSTRIRARRRSADSS